MGLAAPPGPGLASQAGDERHGTSQAKMGGVASTGLPASLSHPARRGRGERKGGRRGDHPAVGSSRQHRVLVGERACDGTCLERMAEQAGVGGCTAARAGGLWP